jgi:hypothetical protein
LSKSSPDGSDEALPQQLRPTMFLIHRLPPTRRRRKAGAAREGMASVSVDGSAPPGATVK